MFLKVGGSHHMVESLDFWSNLTDLFDQKFLKDIQIFAFLVCYWML